MANWYLALRLIFTVIIVAGAIIYYKIRGRITVPEWYDMTGIAQSQAYKCLGNGWTVEVIAHLIRATTDTEKKGQTSLDSF